MTYIENSISAEPFLLYRNPTQTSDEDPTPADVTEENRATYIATDNDLDDPPNPTVEDIEWQITGPDAGKFRFGTSTVTYTPSTTGNDLDTDTDLTCDDRCVRVP